MRSGRYQASYALNGVDIHCPLGTFGNEGDARRWLADERRKIERGDWLPFDQRHDGTMAEPEPAPLPTLAKYSADWMARTPHRPGTAVQYERHLRLRILPTLGTKHLDGITHQVVIAWWRSMTRDGQLRAHDQTYALLRTIMAAALDDELIGEQPCRVKGAGKPSQTRKADPLTPVQVAAIADAMPPRWRLGVLIAAWCGLRSGEVRELRRKDVDVVIAGDSSTAVLRVRRAVTRAGGDLVIGPPKTEAGIRDVPVPKALIPVLEAHLGKWVDQFPDSLLIAREDGSTVPDGQWNRAFKTACRKALATDAQREAAAAKPKRGGLTPLPDCDPDVTFHDLRRTALTSMAVAGATIKELQAAAGHTTAAVAMRYQQIAQSHLDEVMGRVSQMMATAG